MAAISESAKQETYTKMLIDAASIGDATLVQFITDRMRFTSSNQVQRLPVPGMSAGRQPYNSSQRMNSGYDRNQGHASSVRGAGHASSVRGAGHASSVRGAGHASSVRGAGQRDDHGARGDHQEHKPFTRFDCRDGDECNNERCKFVHSAQYVIGDNSAKCKFGESCNKKTCTFIHRKGDQKEEESNAADP
jgi:hypothetical protein